MISDKQDEQLTFGLGYDHNWILDKGGKEGELSLAAQVREPSSGRVMEIYTTEPGIQFYCGNFLDGRLKGKSGKPHTFIEVDSASRHSTFPDSPNQINFPSTILKPGDTYESKTVFKFSAK